MKKNYADLGLLTIGLLWGLGFVITKIGLNDGIGPVYLLTLRFGLASIFVAIIFHKTLITITKKDIKKMFLISIILFSAYAFQIIGSKYTTASKAAFYTGLNVIFVPYISWKLNRNAPDIYTYISTILCLIGVGFISYIPGEQIFTLNIGDAFVIISAVLFGAHIALTGYYSKKYFLEKIIIIQYFISTILFLILFIIFLFIPFTEEKFIILNKSNIYTVLYLGLITTALCLFLQAYFQRYTSSVRAAIFLSTESMFAPIFASIFLKEVLTKYVFLGASCIFLAVILSETKLGINFFKNFRREK